ncbi:RND family efflux transporter, MFP subunit [Propionispira arboris]|uniref:RND family efflux transporter, MFP subunit n=1 Tax=Propionispira arboris TaxID=84035 RepID=A0A1H7BYE8_9FIRM|nr:RND family efflux transporter, MFP subunit [Propionispira arboris]
MKLPARLTALFNKKRCFVIAGIIILFSITGFMIQEHNNVQPISEDIVKVRTITIGNTTDKQGSTYSGEVRGRYESQLAFQVSGKIIKRYVELGTLVNAGDVLMEIDAKDIQQTVNNNAAQVASAQSQVKLAESNLNRYRQLLDQTAISQAQYDQYVNAYNVAVAALQQASAQYAQGANQMGYSLLHADKTGVVSTINAETGQVISAGQTVVTIVPTGELEIEINVPENQMEYLRKTEQIQTTFWALPGITINGQIREVAPMADQTTRTFKVRIHLMNPPEQIKLGMTASVQINAQTALQTMTIPLAAIYQDGNTPTSVWVVKNNHLILQPVTIGNFGSETVEVLSGLQLGDCIVTAGVHKLHEGQKVNIGGDTL